MWEVCKHISSTHSGLEKWFEDLCKDATMECRVHCAPARVMDRLRYIIARLWEMERPITTYERETDCAQARSTSRTAYFEASRAALLHSRAKIEYFYDGQKTEICGFCFHRPLENWHTWMYNIKTASLLLCWQKSYNTLRTMFWVLQ